MNVRSYTTRHGTTTRRGDPPPGRSRNDPERPPAYDYGPPPRALLAGGAHDPSDRPRGRRLGRRDLQPLPGQAGADPAGVAAPLRKARRPVRAGHPCRWRRDGDPPTPGVCPCAERPRGGRAAAWARACSRIRHCSRRSGRRSTGCRSGSSRLRQPLIDYLAAERDRGTVDRSIDVEAVTTLVFGASGIVALTRRVNPHADRAALDAQLDAAVTTIVVGIEKRPTG